MNSIIIGSGFGGIAAALRLKAKGHNVTLIEKHNDLDWTWRGYFQSTSSSSGTNSSFSSRKAANFLLIFEPRIRLEAKWKL